MRESKQIRSQAAAVPQDLDSLFFPEVGAFDKDVVNELISEHMVLDDPTNLTEVIGKFQEEAGCHVGESLIEKQRNLRRIVPPILSKEAGTASELINIDLALEWMAKQDLSAQIERCSSKKAAMMQRWPVKEAHEELTFRLHKAKCI